MESVVTRAAFDSWGDAGDPAGLDSPSQTAGELRLELENADLRQLLAQAGIDAAEHNLVEKLQTVVLEELHHRVKNTLAIVLAISNQSLRSSIDMKQAAAAISSRILALGRAHDLLLRTSWTGARLNDLLEAAIAPFETPMARHFALDVADLEINPTGALRLVMTINELCTNAVKYGALTRPEGRVEITGKIDMTGQSILLTWTEQNGPIVRTPRRKSFGMQLIEKSFPEGARASFRPSGVVCEFNLPLAAIQAVGPNPAGRMIRTA
jgi:two-component sensor histidine kinase